MEIRDILRKLCEWKGVEIIEGEICPDHVHLLVSIPPKMSVAGFMGYLKGKSSLMIYQKGILCRYSREKHKCNKRVYSETVKARQRERATEHV